MKAILISIRPKHSCNILNLIKLWEIRKQISSDYVGWFYIYVTKDAKDFLCEVDNYKELHEKGLAPFRYYLTPKRESKYHKCLNGKVVARFWCDKVEEIYGGSFNQFDIYSGCYFVGKECPLYFEQKSCLTQSELKAYLGDKQGKAIHITKLEIFDKPKDISDFSSKIERTCICFNQFVAEGTRKIPLNRAPQSWCYVEV